MTLQTTTISDLPNAPTPLTGAERVPMDQSGETRDTSTQEIANLAGPAITSAVAAHVAAVDPHTQYAQTADDVGLGTDDSPTFAGLTITGTGPVAIPHIHGAIAGNVYLHVRNTSGGTLAAGTCVRVTGSVGSTDRLEVAACDPTDSTKMPAVGVLETSLANNADGDAIIAGELRPFNTAAFTLGRQLYVGAAGALTDSVPTSGVVQAVGSVARVNASTGTIVIGIGGQWPGLVTSTQAGLMRAVDLGDVIVLACSDETTDLTTGTARVTFRMPWAATLTAVQLSVNTAPTGSALIVDVNEGGVSVFSTRPQIDVSAKTSVGSSVTPVISDSALADDAEITVDIDQVGSTAKGRGLKVALYVTRT